MTFNGTGLRAFGILQLASRAPFARTETGSLRKEFCIFGAAFTLSEKAGGGGGIQPPPLLVIPNWGSLGSKNVFYLCNPGYHPVNGDVQPWLLTSS